MRAFSLTVATAAVIAGGLALASAPVPGFAPLGETPTPEARARHFTLLFLEGEDEASQELMDATMKLSFPKEKAEITRSMLRAQQGEVRSIGEGWHEDDMRGYRRYRVPVRFEKATVDFRVVLDDEVRVAGFFVVPHAERPDPNEAPPEGVVEREVLVGKPGDTLPGTLSLPPAGRGPFPGVVIVHGSGPLDRDGTVGPNKPYRDLAWGLAERGVAVLRYDKRSYARPETLVALGGKLTVVQEVITDARAALALLREAEEVDSNQVFVLGHSLGGTLAPRIAQAEPRPAGIIVLAGATRPLPEKMLEQVRYMAALDGVISHEEKAKIVEIEAEVSRLRATPGDDATDPEHVILGAPLAYYRDLESFDAPATAAALGLPTLVLQGERDYQVTSEDFLLWKETLEEMPFACLRIYEELDHLLRAGEGTPGPQDYDRRLPVSSEVTSDIAGWVLKGKCPGLPAPNSGLRPGPPSASP